MTEQEWLECTDPQTMLDFMFDKASHRKIELYTSGSYRCVWNLLDERTRNLMNVRERYFDGLATVAELDSALKDNDQVPHQLTHNAWDSIRPQRQIQLLRDMFGNFYRPVSIDSAWLTLNVTSLAHSIYDERCFTDMPTLLVDALLNAGCTSEALLNHCRQPEEHFRGCWAIDLLLSKECKCDWCMTYPALRLYS